MNTDRLATTERHVADPVMQGWALNSAATTLWELSYPGFVMADHPEEAAHVVEIVNVLIRATGTDLSELAGNEEAWEDPETVIYWAGLMAEALMLMDASDDDTDNWKAHVEGIAWKVLRALLRVDTAVLIRQEQLMKGASS